VRSASPSSTAAAEWRSALRAARWTSTSKSRSAGNSNVVQAKMRTMADLGLQQSIEDILITLDKQYHIIRPLARQEGFFLYLVLDRARANLAMARFRLASIEKDLKI
jgi:hypothetical protein